MATAYSIKTENRKYNYELELATIFNRDTYRIKFSHLYLLWDVRYKHLLLEIGVINK